MTKKNEQTTFTDITITDPAREIPKRGKGRRSHLINNVPNTPENREFWAAVAREARRSKSKVGHVRLRGRGSRENNYNENGASNQSSVSLERATHFAVYLEEHESVRADRHTAWRRGYDAGREQNPNTAALRNGYDRGWKACFERYKAEGVDLDAVEALRRELEQTKDALEASLAREHSALAQRLELQRKLERADQRLNDAQPTTAPASTTSLHERWMRPYSQGFNDAIREIDNER
jgi:hypothetical protein